METTQPLADVVPKPMRGCYVHVTKRTRDRLHREGKHLTFEWLSMSEIVDMLVSANDTKSARAKELLKELDE